MVISIQPQQPNPAVRAAAEAALFKPGQVLDAVVVGKTPDGLTALKIGDVVITAQLPQTLPAGTTLQLQVKVAGPAPQLVVVGPPQVPVAAQAVPVLPLAQIAVLPTVVVSAGPGSEAGVVPAVVVPVATAPAAVGPAATAIVPAVARPTATSPSVVAPGPNASVAVSTAAGRPSPPPLPATVPPVSIATAGPTASAPQSAIVASAPVPTASYIVASPLSGQPVLVAPVAIAVDEPSPVQPSPSNVAASPTPPATVTAPAQGPASAPAVAPSPPLHAQSTAMAPVSPSATVVTANAAAQPLPAVQGAVSAQPSAAAAPVAEEPASASPLLVAQAATRPAPSATDMPKPTPMVATVPQPPAAAPATPAAALSQMIPEALARQNSIGPLLVSLAAAVVKPGLPEPVVKAALQLLAARVQLAAGGPTPEQLEVAVAKSGVYLEAMLAKGAAPAAALGGEPGALKGALTTWLGATPAPVAAAQQAAPPLKGLPPRAEAMNPAPLPNAPLEAARALHGQADAALSRVKLMQLASLPDADSVRAATQELRMELPFLIGHELVMAQFQVFRDAARRKADGKRGWTLRFAMNFSATGEVGAEVGLLGRSVNVALWAADPDTAVDLEAALPELAPALAALGLDPGAVRVRSLPPEVPRPASGQYVDSRR